MSENDKSKVLVSGPAVIKINNSLVGRTIGPVQLSRITASYRELFRQDSPHAFKLVKERVQFELTFDLAEHDLGNLEIGFDISQALGSLLFTETAPQERSLEIEAVDGQNFKFTTAVQVGTGGPIYSNTAPTVIPLRFWILLGTAGTPPKLAGVNLPAQFTYWPETAKRREITKTFGGKYRQGSGVRDEYIHFEVAGMTLAQRNALQARHESDAQQLFQGIHGESVLVWFDELDPIREEGGLHRTAGTFEITGEENGST